MEERGYERLAGWVLAFVGVLAVAGGIYWWVSAAPPPRVVAVPPGEEVAEPDQQQSDYDLLQQVGVALPIEAGSVVYDITMVNAGDWRSYEVPRSTSGHDVAVLCRGGEDLLITLPSQPEHELGIVCDGQLFQVGMDAPGGTVTVRRAGSTAAALAIRISPIR